MIKKSNPEDKLEKKQKEKITSWSPVAVLVFGFAGGILACIVVICIFSFPELKPDHPLLKAPFLIFLSVVFLVAIFYEPLRYLLSRGTFRIEWGDKKITLSEIEENVDTEFANNDAKLDELNEEIEKLREQIGTKLSPTQESLDSGSTSDEVSDIHKVIKQSFPNVHNNSFANIIYHLGNSKFKWRNQYTLVKRTGIEPNEIDTLTQALPDTIIRSRSKKGNIIYRLSDEAKAKFTQLLKK